MLQLEGSLAVLAECLDEVRERLFQLSGQRVGRIYDKHAAAKQAETVNRRLAHGQRNMQPVLWLNTL